MTIPAPDQAVLAAVLDRIIPRDADPGAIDLGTQDYVGAILAAGAVPQAGAIAQGLAQLDHQHEGRFAALPAVARDAALQAVATQPWFQALAELAAEGFYADPGNGGNAGAASWTMIGYRHGLPEGPDGPPGARQEAANRTA